MRCSERQSIGDDEAAPEKSSFAMLPLFTCDIARDLATNFYKYTIRL